MILDLKFSCLRFIMTMKWIIRIKNKELSILKYVSAKQYAVCRNLSFSKRRPQMTDDESELIIACKN